MSFNQRDHCIHITIVARDTSCGLLDLSGTRRSAWLLKPGKIARIAIGSSRVTLGNPAFCG